MQPVGKHFTKIADKAYARHGAAWAGLLSSWATIVGDDLAAISEPDKIRWPGHRGTQQTGRSKHQKIGGVLTIKVAYGRALEIQHTAPQIIDRINAYYGYSAIAQLKITQGKIAKPEKQSKVVLPPLADNQKQALENQIGDIADDGLKGALSRLARGVLAKEN
jgi:hypothetical protein